MIHKIHLSLVDETDDNSEIDLIVHAYIGEEEEIVLEPEHINSGEKAKHNQMHKDAAELLDSILWADPDYRERFLAYLKAEGRRVEGEYRASLLD